MTSDLHAMEIQRERWRRARQDLHLIDVHAADLGTGGLGAHVQDLSVRFLILPVDPEEVLIPFDADFWSWFLEERPNPFGGRPTDWGREHRPSALAAIRHDRRNDEWSWDTYLAVHRSGAIEFGLGSVGGFEYNDSRFFCQRRSKTVQESPVEFCAL